LAALGCAWAAESTRVEEEDASKSRSARAEAASRSPSAEVGSGALSATLERPWLQPLPPVGRSARPSGATSDEGSAAARSGAESEAAMWDERSAAKSVVR
jgi:hypothetical protein